MHTTHYFEVKSFEIFQVQTSHPLIQFQSKYAVSLKIKFF